MGSPVQFFLILSCLVAVVSDMALVWWAKQAGHPLSYLIAGILLGNAAIVIWAYSMRTGVESAVAITVYALATVIGCSFLGIVIFREPVSIVNAIGMGLGLVALVMVSLKV